MNDKTKTMLMLVLTLLTLGCGGSASLIEDILFDEILVSSPPLPTSTPIPVSAVIDQMREASQLVTVEMVENVTVHERQANPNALVVIPIRDTEFTLIMHGSVQAGFDLTAIGDSSQITITGSALTVKLPPPQILSYGAYDYEVMDIDYPALGTGELRPGTIESANQRAIEGILDAACEGGILHLANQNAEEAFGDLLVPLGFDKVHVVTQNATCTP